MDNNPAEPIDFESLSVPARAPVDGAVKQTDGVSSRHISNRDMAISKMRLMATPMTAQPERGRSQILRERRVPLKIAGSNRYPMGVRTHRQIPHPACTPPGCLRIRAECRSKTSSANPTSGRDQARGFLWKIDEHNNDRGGVRSEEDIAESPCLGEVARDGHGRPRWLLVWLPIVPVSGTEPAGQWPFGVCSNRISFAASDVDRLADGNHVVR
jgi:hypothetical protein